MKTIIQQDDCAPDALQFFDEEFNKIVGESRNDFMKTAKLYSNCYTSCYTKGDYELSISAEDPYWKLCALGNEA